MRGRFKRWLGKVGWDGGEESEASRKEHRKAVFGRGVPRGSKQRDVPVYPNFVSHAILMRGLVGASDLNYFA